MTNSRRLGSTMRGLEMSVEESGENVIIWPLIPDPEPGNGKIKLKVWIVAHIVT